MLRVELLEIGRASTTSVVISCIMILFADYILAAIFFRRLPLFLIVSLLVSYNSFVAVRPAEAAV